ncbi:hypothetical protein ABIE40_005508 [Rhizobium sp. OAE497]
MRHSSRKTLSRSSSANSSKFTHNCTCGGIGEGVDCRVQMQISVHSAAAETGSTSAHAFSSLRPAGCTAAGAIELLSACSCASTKRETSPRRRSFLLALLSVSNITAPSHNERQFPCGTSLKILKIRPRVETTLFARSAAILRPCRSPSLTMKLSRTDQRSFRGCRRRRHRALPLEAERQLSCLSPSDVRARH